MRRPSAVDAELIAEAAQHNLTVTPRQLERWRQQGLIPRTVRRGLGRGRGTEGEVTDEMRTKVFFVAIMLGLGYTYGDIRPWVTDHDAE